jgi:hypothetical protein
MRWFWLPVAGVLGLVLMAGEGRAEQVRSCPPLRPAHRASQREKAPGPAYYVSPQGDDTAPGTEERPWRTIGATLPRLTPGDTLYLRGGAYFEQVYCAVAGTAESPITIRSYPGEVAMIDGGIPQFQTDPAAAWQPAVGGTPDEFVSTKPYKNIRDVVGLFGDSNVGLQTYWYAMDLRATNESWIPDESLMVKPVYCGPGLWYDKQTGLIHCRLAHTQLQLSEKAGYRLPQYRGETDPRRLSLVIAPFGSRPLVVDQAMYVRFQDLVIRGGGYVTVDLAFGVGIEFDQCTIYCGTYGVWSKGTGPLKMTHCGVYGMIPPWAFRTENCSYAYSPFVYPPFLEGLAAEERQGSSTARPKQVTRHIARLNTHAVLATAGGYEFETFYYPLNHDWEIAYCEFTDGHDGVYPSGRNIRFHHNWVDNMQDDAVYVSSPTPYISDGVFIYQNFISTFTTAFGAHARGGPGGDIYIFRNVVDSRRPVHFNRPTPAKPEGEVRSGANLFLVHNADHLIHIERLYFYQNTMLFPVVHLGLGFTGGLAYGWEPETSRRVFNNIFVFYGLDGKYPIPFYGMRSSRADLQIDGDLHWSLSAGQAPPDGFFKPLREHPIAKANLEKYPAGLGTHCLVGDPRFVAISSDPQAANDYRLRRDSPAIGKGVPLPAEWPDPLRPAQSPPDIGAIPAGGEPLKVGIHGRITAGLPGDPN